MNLYKKLIVVALPLALAAGCTTAEDKAMIDKANMQSTEARTAATQASDAANRAAASAAAAAQAAQQAATAAQNAANESKAASTKVDAMFRRGIRK